MPTFIPINAQEVAETQTGDAGDKIAVGVPHAHVEQQVRDCIESYSTALQLWSKGQTADALTKLEGLSTSSLISQQQESHIETECDAYCNEYGGITMNRLRSLVFKGIGTLVIQEASRSEHGSAFCDIGTPRFEIAYGRLDPELVEAGHKAVESLTTAIGFDLAETTTYLMLGQCAILLGCLDIATAAVSRGLCISDGSAMHSELHVREFVCGIKSADALVLRLQSPARWWCLKTMCQVALLKGDLDIVEHIVTLFKDAGIATESIPLCAEDIAKISPAPFQLQPVPMFSTMLGKQHYISEETKALTPQTMSFNLANGSMSLSDMGQAILDTFARLGDSDTASSSLLRNIRLVIASNTAIDDTVKAMDAGEPADSALVAAVTNDDSTGEPAVPESVVVPEEKNPETKSPTTGDEDKPTLAETPSGNKRRESFSGDEMPTKRRSTRFIERSTSNLAGPATPGAGAGVLATGNRAASVRGNQGRSLSMTAEFQDSTAYDEAKSCTEAWLQSIGFRRQSTYSELWTVSKNVARSIALYLKHRRQLHQQRHKSKDRSELENCGDVVGWCLAANAGDDGDRPCQSSRYVDSLKLLLAVQAKDNNISAQDGVQVGERLISEDECKELFRDNHGAIDLLLRYYDRLCVSLCTCVSAVSSVDSRLAEIALRILEQIHEAAIDWTNDALMSGMSGREYEKAIRHGLVALQLLSGVLLQQNSLNDMYQGMRAEWIRVTDIVVQAAESDAACHDLVLVYYIAKEWADYELAVAADDIDSAERHIVCCEELFESSQMQESGNAWTRGVKCTFSGVPVSLDLVKSRRGHAASFQALVNAESALASDKEGAAQQLESIVKKFTVDNGAGGHFSFVQKVAAVRLLASIYHEQSQASSEARLIATELFLYIDRLAAECGSDESDTQSVPVRSVVRKCVDCLQRIGEIAQDDGKVWEELARMLDTELFSIGSKQMLALALEMAAYFLTDQPADSLSNVSPEATLVVMAAWLATKLSVGIQPVAVPKGFACVLLNGSDSAIDEKAAVPNTDADADAAPDQANPNDGNLDSQDTSGDSSQLLDKYTLLLSAVHQLFGERGMCTVADGCLLKHQMAVCRKALDDDRDNLAYWDTTASCLRCLFDIKLYSSRTLMHACEHLEMDEASASLVYRLVEPELLDAVRSRKGTGLRSDLKAVVDQASAALGELDVDGIPHLSMNMDVLDGYLDGTSMPTFGEAERSLRYSTHDRPLVSLPLRDLHGASKFPDAFWSLPFVRATVQHDLLRSRMKSGMSRAIQDYDEVIDDFKLNVALHPTSSEAWHHLGRAFWDLAEEILLGTANEIVEQRFDVAMLQRSALSCAVQAKQYLEPLPTVAGVEEKRTSKTRNDDESECSDSEEMEQARRLHIRVVSTAGNILYTIGAQPLPLLPLQILPSNVLPSDDEDGNAVIDSQHWDMGRWTGDRQKQQKQKPVSVAALARSLTKRYDAPPARRIFALARGMFSLVSALDNTNWRWSYMLGKSIGKLGEFTTACACYLNACYLAVSGGKPFSSTTSLAGAAAAASSSSSAAAAVSVSVSASAAVPPAISHSASATLREGPAADAQYKLISAVSKLLYAGKMDSATALRFLTAMPYSLFVCEDPVNGSSSDNSVPDSVAVFQQIRSVVQKMCASEKRRWHHRPCYLLAWIEHRVFGDSEAAKQTLLPLLQMRNQTKQLASFYKTDSELPGKHYLYLEKYLSLYIDTLIATADIDSVTLLRRKLKRSSEALYDPSVLQAKTNTAYVLVLQQLVVRLNCPKFVVDEEGKEHIILQKSLEGAQAVRVYPVTRHCRLNRPVFNHVRDMALSNITHFVELGEHLRGALRTLEKQQQQELSAASTVVGTVRTSVAAVEEYLVDAVRAIELFELVLDEKKKHTDEPLALGQLADMLADLFIRILHRYGQVKRVIHPPPYQEGDMAELIEFCNRSTAMLLPSGADGKSESQRNTEGGSFWHDIIFDASRNETSQLYKLLDPLLEFSINRLLDAVRSAKAQKTYVFSYKPRAEAVAILPPPMSAVVTQSTSTAAEQQSHPEQQPHQGTFQ